VRRETRALQTRGRLRYSMIMAARWLPLGFFAAMAPAQAAEAALGVAGHMIEPQREQP